MASDPKNPETKPIELVTAEDVRGMDKAELEAYVTEAGPRVTKAFEDAEAIIAPVRAINDALFVARDRLARMGTFAG
ncbi:hypothetical protein SEA_MACGULLY_15 [Rhodococcus phage MacGully]|nr:hypothetical protein SEA_MACGULLY_15 [Rhodococcus phage MacGully]